METASEHPQPDLKKFDIEVVYNGPPKPLTVEVNEEITSVLKRAIALYNVTQQPHLLGLFRVDNTAIPDKQSVKQAGLEPGQTVVLKPDSVRGG
jgi:hypothetical protein